MKNNNPEVNQEFEKLIKDRMNELSSSVDCFDKISARAFPEKNPDFSESGFAVCDLENVTGKSKKPMFLKWSAIAVACAVCTVVITQTPILNNFVASFGKSPKKIYSEIIEEIKKETSINTYKVYDIPVADYIKYDRLITPLYSCPFADCGKDNINVRIFVRTYNDIPTNQIYAVEYVDDYKQSNFIAVADTKAKFTDDDFEYIDEIYKESDDMLVKGAVMANFTPTITAESHMIDKSGNKVSVASFEYENIFKSDEEEIYYSPSQFIYYGNSIDEYPDTYYYDINNSPDMESTWKNTVCFDGFSSMPEESQSLFTRTPLFDKSEISENAIACGYVIPDFPVTLADSTDNYKNEFTGIDFYSLYFKSYEERNVSKLAVPYDSEVLKTLKMYFAKSGIMFSSDSNVSLILESSSSETKKTIDSNYNNLLSDEEQEEMLRIQEEKAKAEAEMTREKTKDSENKLNEEKVRQDIVSYSDERF